MSQLNDRVDHLLRRWFLQAEPLPDEEVEPDLRPASKSMAEAINKNPMYFMTNIGALWAAQRYAERLKLPVALKPVRRV